MAIEISSFDELDPAKVESMIATMSQLMAEKHPEVELTRGVFHDLVLYFNGLLNAAVRENIDRVLQSNSLLKITQNPAIADDAVVDGVLSNYNITRGTGTPAVGSATVVLGLPVITNISAATQFSAATTDVKFIPTRDFTLLPPGINPTSDNERPTVVVGDGTYAATITVAATAVGASGNIRRSEELIPNGGLNNVVSVYATSDFIGGQEPPTNEEYLQKLSAGLAAKTIGGRASYAAMILNQPEFVNTAAVSVLGFGDKEQQRDQHGIIPMSGGGKVDIYAQTNPYAQAREHLMQATYVGRGPTGTIWQLIFGRDEAPGFYEVIKIVPPKDVTSSGYGVVQDLRNANLTELDFVPDILFTKESAYTRYQTAVIRFEDTDTLPTTAAPLTPGVSKKMYAVTTVSMPLIKELQDFISSRENRPRGTDVLVKAAVPCFTKISFTVRKLASAADPDIAAIQQAVADTVASVGFSGQLHASLISSAAHKYLSAGQALGPIDMFGRIRTATGGTTYLRNSTVLQIPDDPDNLVTGRTTAFLTSPADVSVSVVVAGFLN
jgi:hypothetical protein